MLREIFEMVLFVVGIFLLVAVVALPIIKYECMQYASTSTGVEYHSYKLPSGCWLKTADGEVVNKKELRTNQ